MTTIPFTSDNDVQCIALLPLLGLLSSLVKLLVQTSNTSIQISRQDLTTQSRRCEVTSLVERVMDSRFLERRDSAGEGRRSYRG